MTITSYWKSVSNSMIFPVLHSLVILGGNEKNEDKVVNVNESESLSQDEKDYEHIFEDPKVAEHYRELYEQKKYECRHLFDPHLTWSSEEERKITWKNDFYVTFWVFIIFLSMDLDRYNIALALSDNMLTDLKLNTDDFNLGNTVNFICFLGAEIPSQLLSKWIGPDKWIPIQMCLWSVVAMTQAAMRNRGGFLATRALIGAFQGGFLPDVCLWMSYFYTSKEMITRMTWFYIALPLSQIVSSFLGLGLLHISTGSIQEGWRWLFLIEGAITLVLGILGFFVMPASVAQTRTWYRKNGWYTEREEKILVNKVLRDDPQKGDMHNREPIDIKSLAKEIVDVDMWPIYIIRILGDIGTSPISVYLTLTFRNLGFNVYETIALTTPASFGMMITMLLLGWLTAHFNQIALILLAVPIWELAGLFVLRYWKGSQTNAWGTYALTIVTLSHPPLYPVTMAWCSANSNSVRSRAVSAALVNMFSQVAGIIGSNIYRQDDKPLYHRGNTQLIGIAFGTLGACLFAKFYYLLRNRHRERIWDKMNCDEKERYIQFSTDDGNKRLDFRFKH